MVDGYHIYIEADRASEKGNKIRQKIDQYLNYLEEQHPTYQACVLFVVQLIDDQTSSRRLESLKGVIERHCEKQAWDGFAQFVRLVTLSDLLVEEALSEPICRVCGREGRHHLVSEVEFVQQAGMLPGPDDII